MAAHQRRLRASSHNEKAIHSRYLITLHAFNHFRVFEENTYLESLSLGPVPLPLGFYHFVFISRGKGTIAGADNIVKDRDKLHPMPRKMPSQRSGGPSARIASYPRLKRARRPPRQQHDDAARNAREEGKGPWSYHPPRPTEGRLSATHLSGLWIIFSWQKMQIVRIKREDTSEKASIQVALSARARGKRFFHAVERHDLCECVRFNKTIHDCFRCRGTTDKLLRKFSSRLRLNLTDSTPSSSAASFFGRRLTSALKLTLSPWTKSAHCQTFLEAKGHGKQ